MFKKTLLIFNLCNLSKPYNTCINREMSLNTIQLINLIATIKICFNVYIMIFIKIQLKVYKIKKL